MPSFIKINVGILDISYSAAISSHSSTSILRKTTSFSSCNKKDIYIISENFRKFDWIINWKWIECDKTFDNSSISGPIILHGPHHTAKKSITTKLLPTSLSLVFKSSYNKWENNDCSFFSSNAYQLKYKNYINYWKNIYYVRYINTLNVKYIHKWDKGGKM